MDLKEMNIRNIIFDLGNVLLDIDYTIMEKNMMEITGLDFRAMDDELRETFYKFETGKIPYVVFFNYITRISHKKALINEMLPAWNSMLLEMKPEIWNLLNELSLNFDLYLISNTNEIHVEWLENYLQNNFSLEEWNQKIFRKVYYSNEIGLRKPQPECFNYILSENKLIPDECLFIDDILENVKGAAQSGMQTLLYDKTNKTLDKLLRNEK